MLAKNAMAEALDLLDDVAKYEATMAAMTRRLGPLQCDLTEDATANWYFVRVKMGEDIRAMRRLAKRRFGVFRPMLQREDKRTGKVLQGRVPMFPGYLFVLPWDMEANRSRIVNCPGVAEIFCYPNTDKPVVIADKYIMRMRAQSAYYDDSAPETADGPRQGNAVVQAERQISRVRRLKKPQRKELERLKARAEQLGVFDQSTWDKLNALDPGKRIALFKRTLTGTALVGCSA